MGFLEKIPDSLAEFYDPEPKPFNCMPRAEPSTSPATSFSNVCPGTEIWSSNFSDGSGPGAMAAGHARRTINSRGAPPSSRLARRRRGLFRSCHTLVRVNTVWLNNNNDNQFPIRLQDPYVDVIIVTANYPDGKFALIYPFAEKDFHPPIGIERLTAGVRLANSPQLITPNTTRLTETSNVPF